MAKKRRKKKPAHLVLLEALEEGLRYQPKAGEELTTFSIAAIVKILCHVLNKMAIPDKVLPRVIGRLRKMTKMKPPPHPIMLIPLQELIERLERED